MLGLVGKRLVAMVGVLFAVSVLTYLLLSLLPGDPALEILGNTATTQGITAVRHELNLDKSLPVQYVHWIGNAVGGNLGMSYQNGQTVASEIKQTFPVTLELTILSLLIALIVAIPVGILSARKPGKVVDRVITAVTLGFLSIPNFILAVLFILLFSVKAHLLPSTGWVPLAQNPVQNLRSALLPALSLALGVMALFARLLRSDMISTLQEDFVLSARSKGLSTRRILVQHVFRPSSFSLLTIFGVEFGALLSGAVLIEQIFALPGMGRLLVSAILSRDLLTVQGVVLVITVSFVVVNFVVDIGYSILDPRVRRASGG